MKLLLHIISKNTDCLMVFLALDSFEEVKVTLHICGQMIDVLFTTS